jgi:hypothetical protein
MHGYNIKSLSGPIFFLALLFVSASCSLPIIGGDDDSTPTPSPDDIVTFDIPLFSTTLSPGETIQATQMSYLGREGPAYKVTIDGQEALKRVGDSFQWRGVIAPGVASRYNLRISPTFSSSDMLAIGSVELNIFNPVPVQLENPGADSTAELHFSNVKIDHKVISGGQVPGTPFVFEEMTVDGAKFSGVEGFPYRAIGDSLFWSGRLRGNVAASYEMRVASLNEERVRLIGIAELWITPTQ